MTMKFLPCRSAYDDDWKPAVHPLSRDGDELPLDEYRRRMTSDLPEGLTVVKCGEDSYERDGETRTYKFTDYALPEAGPTRAFYKARLCEGVVLPIGGKRYRVQVLGVLGGNDEGYPRAEQRKVLFEETDEPETPFETWTNEEAIAQRIKEIEANLAEARKMLADIEAEGDSEEDPYLREDLERDIERKEKELERHKSGQAAYSCNAPVVAFGQPQFIQSPVYPVKDGRCAMHLMTLNTGWGDCGNEVILFTVDENGEPDAVWHEASCC